MRATFRRAEPNPRMLTRWCIGPLYWADGLTWLLFSNCSRNRFFDIWPNGKKMMHLLPCHAKKKILLPCARAWLMFSPGTRGLQNGGSKVVNLTDLIRI
jgi:hypothetical protein